VYDDDMSIIRVTRGIPRYNIQIGPITKAVGHNPSAILSVTDSYTPEVMQTPHFHWVPINEIGKSWGYQPFYTTKRILDFWCLDLKLPFVSVCCSAGVHRSPMIAFGWLLSQEGATPESVAKEFYGSFDDPLARYHKDIERGYIPPNLPEFYKAMRENPGWSYMGILQSLLMYERISYITDREAIRVR
jgi:hypothetical protein